MRAYLFSLLSAIKLHFFFGVFLHFITGADTIFERILYTIPPELKPARELQQGREVFQEERQDPERQTPEREQASRRRRKAPRREKAVSRPQEGRQEQAKPRREVSQRSAEQGRQEAPVTQRQENTPKKGSRSERDSHAIKISSSIRRESGDTRATSERPSVEAKLKAYRVQMRKTSAPAKAIGKSKGKSARKGAR